MPSKPRQAQSLAAPRAVVLFSGGRDSTLAVSWALRQGYVPTLLEFEHIGRPRGERAAAARIRRHLGSPARILLRLELDLRPRRATPGYLATRNLLLHAAAQAAAETLGAKAVVAGHVPQDADSFPDADPRYLRAIARLAKQGRHGRGQIPILLPLQRTTPARRERLATLWDSPTHLAWSCWEDGARPCRRCEKCRENPPSP